MLQRIRADHDRSAAPGAAVPFESVKGVWQIRYDGAPDADGKTKKVAETVHGSKRDAK